MTKQDSEFVHVGTKCWSAQTGLGKAYPVTEIRHVGPRHPYFVLDGLAVTYRDVTRSVNIPTCSTEPRRAMSEADRLERKRARRRARYLIEKAAGV